MPADVGEPDHPRALRVDVRRLAERTDPPPSALPRQQRHERRDHRAGRRDVAEVAHQTDADRVFVEVQRVRAHHVEPVALARVRVPGRIVLRPAPFVDPAERVDEPVVRDVDVAVVQLVRVDAAREPVVVGEVVRRSRVVDDDLLDVRVERGALVAQRLVRAPLRARPDPRHRPVALPDRGELGRAEVGVTGARAEQARTAFEPREVRRGGRDRAGAGGHLQRGPSCDALRVLALRRRSLRGGGNEPAHPTEAVAAICLTRRVLRM